MRFFTFSTCNWTPLLRVVFLRVFLLCRRRAKMANGLDMDALLDEVIARKGAYKYKDGFSEENWEEVLIR